MKIKNTLVVPAVAGLLLTLLAIGCSVNRSSAVPDAAAKKDSIAGTHVLAWDIYKARNGEDLEDLVFQFDARPIAKGKSIIPIMKEVIKLLPKGSEIVTAESPTFGIELNYPDSEIPNWIREIEEFAADNGVKFTYLAEVPNPRDYLPAASQIIFVGKVAKRETVEKKTFLTVAVEKVEKGELKDEELFVTPSLGDWTIGSQAQPGKEYRFCLMNAPDKNGNCEACFIGNVTKAVILGTVSEKKRTEGYNLIVTVKVDKLEYGELSGKTITVGLRGRYTEEADAFPEVGKQYRFTLYNGRDEKGNWDDYKIEGDTINTD